MSDYIHIEHWPAEFCQHTTKRWRVQTWIGGVEQEYAFRTGKTSLKFAETFNLPIHRETDCILCGIDTFRSQNDYYMVHTNVWRQEAGFGPGMAHRACLSKTINRPLVYQDFTDAPINVDIKLLYQKPKQTRPVALLDIDGVSSDFIGHALSTLRNIGCPEHLIPDQHTQPDWDYWNSWMPLNWQERLLQAMREPGWCLGIPVLTGAAEGIRELQKHADVYLITAPMKNAPHWIHERILWAEKHLGIESDRIIHCSVKHLFKGDFFVDDKPDNVLKYAEAHAGHSQIVCWSAPYNDHMEHLSQHITRTNSWDWLVNQVQNHDR